MSPATLPTRDTADGVASMIPRLIRSVENALSRLNTAERHQRYVRDFHSMFPKLVSKADLTAHQASQDVDTAVRLLRYAVLSWASLSGVTLSPDQPIPCLAGTEYDGASLSDLEV